MCIRDSQLGEQPYLDELKILVAENRFDEKHVRDVTARVKKLVEDRGHPVRGVDVPRPGRHPHADLMNGLLLAMASFGLFIPVSYTHLSRKPFDIWLVWCF